MQGSDDSQRTGLTAYGCEPAEAALFERLAADYNVSLTVTEAPLSEAAVSLVAGNRCISVNHKTRIDRTMLQALSKAGVRYISTRSIGYNHIDIAYAKSIGITVGNVTYSAGSVADYTLMLLLMLLRNAKSTIERTNNHDYRLQATRGRELGDLTVGVIGTGRIGAAVIARLRGFGCQVLAHDKRAKVAAAYVPLDDLLQQSDIVTLHAPLTEATYHLLDQRRIQLMKPGAYIINTSRGPLLDTGALVAALESGRLAGAALDVLEGEEGIFYRDHSHTPMSETLTRLQRLPNVIITPHTAYYTDHALRDMVSHSVRNCLEFEKENPA